MLLEIYLLTTAFAFIFFFLSFSMEPRNLFSAVSMVMFFTLAIASGAVDKVFCEWSTDWKCVTQPASETGMMVFNAMFGLLNLVYLLANTFGYAMGVAPDAKKEQG